MGESAIDGGITDGGLGIVEDPADFRGFRTPKVVFGTAGSGMYGNKISTGRKFSWRNET